MYVVSVYNTILQVINPTHTQLERENTSLHVSVSLHVYVHITAKPMTLQESTGVFIDLFFKSVLSLLKDNTRSLKWENGSATIF